MPNEGPLLPESVHVTSVTRETVLEPSATVLSTRDHEVIRGWAAAVGAEPATGEETWSGPATTMKVTDGGAGLRFNFPALNRFRPISWDEWFDHFNSHDLTFVYDNQQPGQAPNARYRIVRTQDLA